MPAKSEQLRILVLGYVVRRPLGGCTWPTLQYALGLLRLGHDVYFFEDSDDYPSCYDPSRHVTDEDPSFGLSYATDVFERFGLGERWVYYDAHRTSWLGPCKDRVAELCESADLLINVSGINPIRPWLAQIPRRVYLDTDPAFEQVRQVDDPARRALALAHNVFLTLGENIPAGKARYLPDVGLPWQASRQPVVLELWPVGRITANSPFTTVMLWSSYTKRLYNGQDFGMKAESFDPYWDLPSAVDAKLELAVGGPQVPRERLRGAGWSIVNPLEPTRDPWTYQRYLAASCGEFTVAKHGYVKSRCGWFSERSAHYLASGRAVITQDTGFGEWIPTGEGLLAFSDRDEAIEAIAAVQSDPGRHGRRARELAVEFFDSDRVLTELIDQAMQGEPRSAMPEEGAS